MDNQERDFTRGVKQEALFDLWNDFSFRYSDYLSRNFEALGIHMAHLINLDQMGPGSKILELGCGDGTLAANLALMKPEGCELIASDLVPNMCRLTAARFSILAEIVASGILLGARQRVFAKLQATDVPPWPETKFMAWPHLGVSIYEANNEDLSPMQIPDQKVDGIVASLSLHIVNDPKKMLAEMRRVLKPKGKFALTVLGSKEHAYYKTIADEASKKFSNKPKPERPPGWKPPRDQWHLSDRSTLAALITSAGFEDVIISDQQVHFLDPNPQERDTLIRRDILEFTVDGSPEYHAAFGWMQVEQDRVRKTLMRPIGTNFLLAVATKPV